jgi:hypothetical protein
LTIWSGDDEDAQPTLPHEKQRELLLALAELLLLLAAEDPMQCQGRGSDDLDETDR